ncbi:MAG: protein translocase subunit SecD [Chloroflexi bacterium]|nr:protein translocase subunit SecD [Chloroflexota bacterium]
MKREFRKLIFLGVLFAVAVAAIAIPRIDFGIFGARFERGQENTFLGLTLGLDLQGGTHLVYRGANADGSQASRDDMEGVRRIVESRVNQFGLSEPTVQLLGNPPDRVLVQLPGLTGESITVRHSGGVVGIDQIKQFLASPEVNRPDAEVKKTEDGSTVMRFGKLEPAVRDEGGDVTRESEANRIRAALVQRFPANVFIAYPAGTSTPETLSPEATTTPGAAGAATSTPPARPPTIENINGIVGDLRIDGATVTETNPGVFSISIPNFQRDQVDAEGKVTLGHASRIREKLVAGFGAPAIFSTIGDLEQFTVGGGVQEAKLLIGQTAQLEFRERTCSPIFPPDQTTAWPPDGLSAEDWLAERCRNPRYYSEVATGLSGRDLIDAFAGTQPGIARPVVNIQFNDRGAEEFFRVTERISGDPGNRLLAIFLDGKELLAPTAQQAIAGGRAFIQGPDFTAERARTISIQLKSGALPVRLELIQERNVEATLGADSLRRSMIAGGLGLLLVIGFMVTYYKLPGVVASIALVLYASILISGFKMLPITLTLAGVAALILSIGVAVDANILIAERTKEELRAGRSLIAAINTGFDRAWPSIRDSNVSTMITTAVLFWFGDRLGTSLMQGFALTLFIGTLASMFTAVTASRVLMRTIASSPLGKRPTAYVPVGAVGTAEPASTMRS